MSQASVTFELGSESVTSVLDIDLPTGGIPLVGDVSGTFGDCFVAGDLNLTGNLFIEGLMTGIDTFHVQGNGFTVFFQNGGRADLHGKFKAPWGPWGTDSTGWVAGDRLAVAPTKTGVFVPSELTWSNWSMARPVNSPDVTFGSVRKPEVVNLSQSIVFENLARGFHFHDSAGVQSLSDVKFLNCGTSGIVGNYPVHFHMNGNNTRGSLLERIVVEGGKNHAFVPHASHGITFRNTVAYKTTGVAYWWDRPTSVTHTENNTEDVLYDHALAMWGVDTVPTVPGDILAGFELGAGSGNRILDSAATCIQGPKGAAGFLWPAQVNHNIGGLVWEFARNVAHNNKRNGTFTWQNDHSPHVVEDFVAYHNGTVQVEHGAYVNVYTYRRLVLMGGDYSFMLHALGDRDGPVTLEDIVADRPLFLPRHQAASTQFTIIRRCQFPQVIYRETFNGENWSWIRYEDCGLTPADFDLAGIWPASLIEITEGGVLTHSWAGGWA